MNSKPVALVTGVGRRVGIGAAIAVCLAKDGWDIATTYWNPYDESNSWKGDPGCADWLQAQLSAYGTRATAFEADLRLVESPALIFDEVEERMGPVTALVLSHCHGKDSTILDTTIESFDAHYAVNARASWLLIREFGMRLKAPAGSGRIVALTSDHVAGNLPYGSSKGALDRIVLAAAEEFRELGVSANVINPGPTDTGWMNADQIADFSRQTPGGRPGLPQDCAQLVRFLCSEEGVWINGQLLHSNGGFQ